MFEKIVVPLDRSKAGEVVLPYVEALAAVYGSAVKLVGVVEAEPSKENVQSSAPTVDKAGFLRLYLLDVAKRIAYEGVDFGMSGKNKIDFEVLVGNVAREILKYAEYLDAGLIVLASHGSGNEDEWSIGNISSKVLRASKKPVLLIHREPSAAALEQKKLVHKILVPLDGSKLGEAAIPYTQDLAAKLQAEMVLVHVTEPLVRWGMYDSNPADQIVESPETRDTEAEEYLASVVKSLGQNKGIAVSAVALYGIPARQIVNYARENKIDLIAMSTHGRSGLGQWVFGSVTDKVLHSGGPPVLVVRPTGG
jgi:nucleotide-binding universal stress UspA family protein